MNYIFVVIQTEYIYINDDRITKVVFNMDYMRCSNNWCSDLKDVLTKLNLTQYFTCNLDKFSQKSNTHQDFLILKSIFWVRKEF
jgi:hypothetical protein